MRWFRYLTSALRRYREETAEAQRLRPSRAVPQAPATSAARAEKERPIIERPRSFDLPEQDRCDEITGEDEEDVCAQGTSRDVVLREMVSHDGDDREATKPVQLRDMPELDFGGRPFGEIRIHRDFASNYASMKD
jgi:hypothetical protein